MRRFIILIAFVFMLLVACCQSKVHTWGSEVGERISSAVDFFSGGNYRGGRAEVVEALLSTLPHSEFSKDTKERLKTASKKILGSEEERAEGYGLLRAAYRSVDTAGYDRLNSPACRGDIPLLASILKSKLKQAAGFAVAGNADKAVELLLEGILVLSPPVSDK
ncbi:MAG: hypothetical protein GY765_29135 [bacterium]|nr:hypothetical protein [bacterium]